MAKNRVLSVGSLFVCKLEATAGKKHKEEFQTPNKIFIESEGRLDSPKVITETKKKLRDAWMEFYISHLNNPEAKTFHVCHADGGSATVKELLKIPQEVRNRVVVLAIASDESISKKLCYSVRQYMGKNDFIKTIKAKGISKSSCSTDPNMDDNFQSPKFELKIKKSLCKYLNE
jgi:hypothetical protein